MKRLTSFEHDIVGHVNDIVNGTDTACLEPIAQPSRRRRDPDIVNDPRRIARAELRVFDLDE